MQYFDHICCQFRLHINKKEIVIRWESNWKVFLRKLKHSLKWKILNKLILRITAIDWKNSLSKHVYPLNKHKTDTAKIQVELCQPAESRLTILSSRDVYHVMLYLYSYWFAFKELRSTLQHFKSSWSLIAIQRTTISTLFNKLCSWVTNQETAAKFIVRHSIYEHIAFL